MMTKREWWIGVGVVALAIVIHAAVPRYTWRHDRGPTIRIDRWTGASVIGGFGSDGRWASAAELNAQRQQTEADKAWDKWLKDDLIQLATETASDATEKATTALDEAKEAIEVLEFVKSGQAPVTLNGNTTYLLAQRDVAEAKSKAQNGLPPEAK
jgi:hypothetical protein